MLRNSVLFLASVIVTLILVEGTLRVLDIYPPLAYPPEPYWTGHFGSHPEYGYALHPGRSSPFDYPPAEPRTTTLTSNSDGFRQNRELEGPDDRPRALVLGDSYTFGVGVEEDERFTDLVEAELPWLRVDNLGMPGWGADLMLLAAESVVERTNPDYVVIALYFDDFRRVRPRYAGLGFAVPRFRLAGDTLELIEYPRPRFYERLHLYEAVVRALYGADRMLSGPSEEEWVLNERIFDRLAALGDKHRFETVLVYLAGPRAGVANDRRRSRVRQYADRRGLSMLDLTSAIHDDSAGAFLPQNAHYSPKGHRQIAGPLTAFLDSLATP
ncbi:MAG: SGNH/GDSL hydrolase family protein [Gemmatimonadota bacterium]|nr:SGNH/GDSL hydrolase family protein [Gemmatimonadota bacterium]